MKVYPFNELLCGKKNSFVHEIIEECTNGKVYSGKFIKSDGTERTFNARVYADGAIKGTGNEMPKHLITYIDNNVLIKNLKSHGRRLDKERDAELIKEARRKSWRSFKIDSLKELNVNGTKYTF